MPRTASYHALAVSAEAWHSILHLIKPWQYLQRLGILSRFGSICRVLAFYSYHTFAVSAEAWHSILHLIKPWQYLPRLGILFYILSSLCSISRGYILSRLGVIRPRLYLMTPWQYLQRLVMLFYVLTWATKAQVQRSAKYRHVGVFSWSQLIPQVAEDTQLASAANLQKNFLSTKIAIKSMRRR